MPVSYSIEKDGNITVYKITDLFSYQDMEVLIQHFDRLVARNPKPRLLVDFSTEKEIEQKTIKMAYERIDKGFPKQTKIALIFPSKGIYKALTYFVGAAMKSNYRAFDSVDLAKKWLLNKAS